MSNILIPKGCIVDVSGRTIITDGTGIMPLFYDNSTPDPRIDWVKEWYETNQEFKSQIDSYLANKNFNKDLSNLIKDEV